MPPSTTAVVSTSTSGDSSVCAPRSEISMRADRPTTRRRSGVGNTTWSRAAVWSLNSAREGNNSRKRRHTYVDLEAPRMRAVAVYPGKANSVHLAEMAKPSVTDVPDGRGVLVRVLRVGVDGTDKEINAAEYGAAPDGFNFLVVGHESFGQVEEVGPNVTELAPGDYVVAMVRRPGFSIYDQIGLTDLTTDDTYFERGINLRHGYLAEYYADAADYLIKIPGGLKHVGVLLEPMTVVE